MLKLAILMVDLPALIEEQPQGSSIQQSQDGTDQNEKERWAEVGNDLGGRDEGEDDQRDDNFRA